MIRTHAKRNCTLQAIWRGPMMMIVSKSNLVFVVEEFAGHQQQLLHAHQMVPYPIVCLEKLSSNELKAQAIHYDSGYHLEKTIRGVCKRQGKFNMLVCWLIFEEGHSEKWETIERVMEDTLEAFEDYLHSLRDRNLK